MSEIVNSYEHSLRVALWDAARVRPWPAVFPQTASQEDRMRRRKALEEAAEVRKIYEELVLKQAPEQLLRSLD